MAPLLYSACAFDKLFAITFFVSNAMATPDFTYGKYFLRNKRVEGAHCSKCSKKIWQDFWLKNVLLPDKFQRNRSNRSLVTRKSFKIQVLNCFGFSTTNCPEVERIISLNFWEK